MLTEHSEGRVESSVIRGKKERKERRSNQIHMKQRGKSSSRGRRWRQNEMIWRRFVSQKNIWKFFSVGLLWWWRPTTAWWLTLRSGEAESDSRRLRSFEFIFIFTNTMWVASPRVSSHEIFSFFFFFIFLLRFSLSSRWAAAAQGRKKTSSPTSTSFASLQPQTSLLRMTRECFVRIAQQQQLNGPSWTTARAEGGKKKKISSKQKEEKTKKLLN